MRIWAHFAKLNSAKLEIFGHSHWLIPHFFPKNIGDKVHLFATRMEDEIDSEDDKEYDGEEICNIFEVIHDENDEDWSLFCTLFLYGLEILKDYRRKKIILVLTRNN